MHDEQRTLGGPSFPPGKRPESQDDARTVLSGGAAQPAPSAGETIASEGWPESESSPFRTPPRWQGFPEPSGDETIVTESTPKESLPLAWLVVTGGPGAKRGTQVALQAETIVGRTKGDLILNGDHAISGTHAKIRLEPGAEGTATPHVFVVYDMASRNGIFIGSRETYRDDDSRTYRRELTDGDHLLLGETTLVFKQVE